MNTTVVRFVCCLALVAGCAVGARAQGDAETGKQIWPEVDLYIPLNPKFRLFVLATITKNKTTDTNTDGQFGVHLDYMPNKRIMLRTGYRYGFSLGDSSPYRENRIVIEQTLRQPLPFALLLSDRNREDLRWVNGDFSVRYRNRVTLEREFKLRSRHVTPYGSAEVFYDTRYDVWNRNRFAAGIQIPLKRGLPLLSQIEVRRQMVLDIYFMHQNDSRSQPNHLNSLGLTFSLYF